MREGGREGGEGGGMEGGGVQVRELVVGVVLWHGTGHRAEEREEKHEEDREGWLWPWSGAHTLSRCGMGG